MKKERGKKFDYIMLLQATSPYRTSKHIDNAIKYYFKMHKSETDSLVSVSKAQLKLDGL